MQSTGCRARAQSFLCTGLAAAPHVDLPGPGIEHCVSPALAGGVLTAGPPGSPQPLLSLLVGLILCAVV